MKHYGSNSKQLSDGTRLDFHFANNAGRGGNNCTITRVCNHIKRPARSACYADYIAQIRVSAWAGKIHISAENEKLLGIQR